MALRYMVYDVLSIDNPMNYAEEADIGLFYTHFKYLKSLQFDDFAHWTNVDFAFYNKIGFNIDPKQLSREGIYEAILKSANENSKVGDTLRNKVFIKENYKIFNHWMSVMLGRSH